MCFSLTASLSEVENDVRESSMPLMKTLSRKSNWPFHASRKIRKLASRSQKKASNHISRKNTNHIHVEQTYIQIQSLQMYLSILVAFHVLNVCISRLRE